MDFLVYFYNKKMVDNQVLMKQIITFNFDNQGLILN